MGKVTETTDTNKTKDQKIRVHCSQCKVETNHIVLQSVDSEVSEVVDYYEGEPVTIAWSDNYQIIECQGCDTKSFRHVSWFSEAEQQVGPNEWDSGTSIWLYPKRSDRTRPIKDYQNVPNTLRRIYRETLECFNSDSFTLCAGGLRAVIEGICSDRQVVDGPVQVQQKGGGTQTVRRKNLEGKIAGLCERGVLTQANTVSLHEHRFLGNEALHELDQPSRDELALAIDILEHTLEALYDMPDKAEALRRIKAQRIKKRTK